MLWCIDSDSSNKEDYLNIEKKKKNKNYIKRNSTVSVYALSHDLQVFLIAGFCASFQIKFFCKWRNSKSIIKDLINHIPSMPRYSWSKKSLVLYKKIKKKNITKFKDAIESYWFDVGNFQGIKGIYYDNFKFINTRNVFMFSLEYPHLSLGFNWILRFGAGYKYNTTIAIRSGRVSKFCPCCGKGEQSFIHWIFECSIFLFKYFLEYENFINRYI